LCRKFGSNQAVWNGTFGIQEERYGAGLRRRGFTRKPTSLRKGKEEKKGSGQLLNFCNSSSSSISHDPRTVSSLTSQNRKGYGKKAEPFL